jgi:hypothetical protein
VLTQAASSAVLATRLPSVGAPQEPPASSLWEGYPRQDQRLVNEVVVAAHFDEKRVRELVTAYPELVNAWWDWGFGDWESPLGAASHVGERGIAEFLIESGARMDVFAAAMFGKTSVVKAFVEAEPGILRALGPHNITLLAHAEAGGAQAAETVAYLKRLGLDEDGLGIEPLTSEKRDACLGKYGSAEHGLTMTCRLNRNELLVADFQAARSQSSGRLLRYRGGDAFFPAGVPSVSIRFSFAETTASAATVGGSVPKVTLTRF